jgi:predicted DNA-binding protein with PD1-like motif
MRIIESREQSNLITLGLGPGEKLLESINEAIKTNENRDGVVISGIGTLKRCHMHYVNTTSFPAENRFYVVEEPLEIGSISGIIANYEAHLHMTVGCRDQRTYAGHLEDGCEVLYLAEIVIMKLGDMGLERRIDPLYGVSLLEERVR